LSGASATLDDNGLAAVVQKKTRRMIGDKTTALRYLIDYAPRDLWLGFPAEMLAGLVRYLHKRIEKENATVIKVTPNTTEGFSEVFIFTPDRKGLFSLLSGALAAGGASIVEARIFTL